MRDDYLACFRFLCAETIEGGNRWQTTRTSHRTSTGATREAQTSTEATVHSYAPWTIPSLYSLEQSSAWRARRQSEQVESMSCGFRFPCKARAHKSRSKRWSVPTWHCSVSVPSLPNRGLFSILPRTSLENYSRMNSESLGFLTSDEAVLLLEGHHSSDYEKHGVRAFHSLAVIRQVELSLQGAETATIGCISHGNTYRLQHSFYTSRRSRIC